MIQYKRWVSMAVVATTVTVMTLGVNTQAAEHHTEMMYASDHMEIASFAQLLQDSERTDEIVMENEYQEAGLLTVEELDKKIAEQKQAEKEAEEKALQEKKEAEEKAQRELEEAQKKEAERIAAEQAEAQRKAEEEAAVAQLQEADKELLASIIFCEAGNQPYEGQVAVGAVIMNRVKSAVYPNSISEVVYQSGQFGPAMTGWLDSVRYSAGYTPSAMQAAIDALSGSNPIGDCLYFDQGGMGYQLGDHYFH
ncbi:MULTISPECIES: cell wall hydrolase [Clostridia]|uniref:Cell wall hydrolase n=1 Tax=Ruminococcus hominis TaxID=2763065 RepID=A0ABR7G983_9FIRM|nr:MULTISPECIES: cell wall hydrolase [Clostridia]MBC5683989.1 cell wall hydrolase [Ruminococcus hominis]MCH4281472.1 cell wall hydrolase [Mediterraneibacter sp. NSJ-151]RHS75879.1 cell wall hydrolase [Firmicutes bacterium AM43-11BH]RHT37857.1 cell wall hydrolase [Firmicutes bacterium AM31-12AC]